MIKNIYLAIAIILFFNTIEGNASDELTDKSDTQATRSVEKSTRV